MGARGDRREGDARMTKKEFDQDFARVTGRADDAAFHDKSINATARRAASNYKTTQSEQKRRGC
jgi:hypothetical protein